MRASHPRSVTITPLIAPASTLAQVSALPSDPAPASPARGACLADSTSAPDRSSQLIGWLWLDLSSICSAGLAESRRQPRTAAHENPATMRPRACADRVRYVRR